MVATPSFASTGFISKVCICCIVGSCIGLAFYGGFQAESELGLKPSNKLKIKQKYTIEDLKRQQKHLPQGHTVNPDQTLESQNRLRPGGAMDNSQASSGDKLKIKQKYTIEDLKRQQKHLPQEQTVNSDQTLEAQHRLRLGGASDNSQASSATRPWSMRSIVACGLLLLVMLKNIKATIDSARSKDKKDQSSMAGGSFGSVMKRMRKILQPVLTSPFLWYTVLVLVVIGGYLRVFKILAAQGSKMTQPEWSLFVSVAGEGYGILWLRSRIHKSKHAQGISAKSVALFAMLYLDTACNFPEMKSQQLDIWACKILEVVSLVLVLDVLYSILVTHRRTYQKELDVVPVKTLVCVSALLAFLYQPSRVNLKPTSVAFTFRIYVDTFALVPQVVMMSLQDRPVHAPIAHFVAVNTMGRMVDLSYWMGEFKFLAGPLKVSFSGWLIFLSHVASLLVVADFFYYYVKSWVLNRGVIMDVPIPSVMDV